ncbi:hypothetical protein BH09BAC3_BH09BAC3_38160 [soil metagenome]
MHKSTQGFEKIDQSLFFKGGAMGAIINNYPWKDHPLGLPDTWKQELITTINLLLHARFPMFLFWGEESFCFYNDAYLPSLGKEGEGKHPCIGKKAKEVWPESWDIIGPQIEEVMKTGEASWNENRPSILYRNNRMENVYWTYSYSPVYTKEGVIEGALVTCIETTEEVLSKRALVETEQTLELALDASNIGIWEWNVQTGKIRWDKQMFGLYGMLPSEDSFLDYTVWRSAVHPEDVSEQESILNGTIQAKQGSKRKFRIFKHDSKELRYFESVDAVRLNGKGETEIIVGTNVDITEQVLLEQQLENLVEERTAELKRSNEDLQQFAHVISHDLKEPIRKMLIFLEKLKQDSTEGMSEKTIHYFDRLKTSGLRMHDMINSMLDYSQIEAQYVTREPINTHLLVDDVIIELELLIEEKRAQIIVESLPVISGYRMLIHQLFYNLIYNALKFSKPDVRPVITIKGESKPNEICIIVSDNGIGFLPDKASKIFDIYVQLNSKEQFGGTGMGLAFCKKIVERHGGKIKAFGRENEGAEFVITFPIRN